MFLTRQLAPEYDIAALLIVHPPLRDPKESFQGTQATTLVALQ